MKLGMDNNLKYLINHDRNQRKHNVVLFGVREDEDLQIGADNAKDDEEKCKTLLEYIGCTDVKIMDAFRLGKETPPEKPRPIKIVFSEKRMAFDVLSKTSKLNDLKKDSGKNIYIKPDKTKSEVSEFQRLGKEKSKLLEKYPTGEDGIPRVILKFGSLKVDGVEVDKYEPVQTLF